MKSRLKKLNINSLFSQLLLLMLASAFVLQCVNFYAIYSIQQSYAREFLSTGHEYVSSVYHAMQLMDPEQRDALAEEIAKSRSAIGQPFHFRIVGTAPDWEADIHYEYSRIESAVRNAVQKSRIPQEDIKTRFLLKTSPEASDPQYADYSFPLLQVMIKMDDGKWLELIQPMSLADPGRIRAQRTVILIGSLVIPLLTVLLMRRATKPLRRLREAAEAFGNSPETAQLLEENGSIEIREAAQSFNSMRKRICDNLNERNRMLAAMGHDLRTPLTRAQLRLNKITPDSLREKFATDIKEIQSIIEQGLELARSLHTSEEAVPMDVIALVESIVDDAQGGRITLEKNVSHDSNLLIMARPTCLKRCIDNLLNNALNYAGKVKIAVTNRKNAVTIDIDDDGPGIPEDLLEKVLEPYYRIEQSRNRESGGIGLGLSIARNMALNNNGSLTLSNRPEGGLRARVVLPLLDPATNGDASSS